MSVTAPAKKDFRFPMDGGAISRIMTWVAAITEAVNGTLPAGFLSADTEGRAAMADAFFNEATATLKFAAGAIAGTLLKDLGVTTAKLAANAVTGPKMDSAGFLAAVVTGRNGAGACTLTGAKIGDKVIANINLTDADSGRASFETTITVADQIQQSSASDLSTKKYEVMLLVQS